MIAKLAADAVLVIHFAFICFAVMGGLLALRFPRIAWIHIPCLVWGTLIEFFGWVCPLTPLENWLSVKAGSFGYEGGFIDYYVMPLVYPPGLSH